MHRFFVPPELLKTTNIVVPLPKELAHQVRDVVRLDIGEQVLLLDNSGDEILATVTKTNKATVEVHLLKRRPGRSEPVMRIILCQGLLKSTRFEWILEKGTELGVSVFSPIICRRSMAGLEDTGSSKIQRWQRIIQEAAEQSGRSRLPELLHIRPLVDALNDIPPNALAIMPWEEEHSLTLHDALNSSIRSPGNVGATLAVAWPITPERTSNLSTPTSKSPSTIVLFIGPEGGLMAEEVAQAQRHGVQVVTLGTRILRAETAAIATVANVMYELGR
ncbi:MAG TPA: 16S rRNA (uracil(1498)-N(3))-methyltransferase [Ktedonobacteraceae bacterium]|jgi:16S rRNA (uracil1498-N3)-methyltransferase